MRKIDTHQHFWNYDPVEYDWINDNMHAIRRNFLPEDLEKQIAECGVTGVVSVQARQTLEETQWLLELANRHKFIHGVVGWVPLIAPDISDILEPLAANRNLRAVRHVLQDEPDPFYMLRPDFNRGIRALKSFGLAYDILIYERHLPQTIEFVDRHPDQIFIVDHLAKPQVRSGAISPWREDMQDLARRPNVYCKLSGLATEAGYASWTEDQLRPYLDVTLKAFGPRRLMFGSDWPVCTVAVEYARWASIVGNAIASLSASEQEQIWSATALKAYNLT